MSAMEPEVVKFKPIGHFKCSQRFSAEVPRQATMNGEDHGEIHLLPGNNFEQALSDLDSFSHIWVLFLFHKNKHWKPMIQPPREAQKKVGVFATRAPYRPNPIGQSCLKVISINKRTITIKGHDLLDGTPILDIKPYISYADSFPEASNGWLSPEAKFKICWDSAPKRQVIWLETQTNLNFFSIIKSQLEHSPTDQNRKRVKAWNENQYVLAYRTWRILFQLHPTEKKLTISKIFSGYSREDLLEPKDKYGDKEIHIEFGKLFA